MQCVRLRIERSGFESWLGTLCRVLRQNTLLWQCLTPSGYLNRPRSIYQYSSMAPRLSGQNCTFFKFLLSSNSQKRLRYKENNTKYRSLTRKPRSHVRILIYRAWPIGTGELFGQPDRMLACNELASHPGGSRNIPSRSILQKLTLGTESYELVGWVHAGTLNSHNKPMQRHFYRPVFVRYFSREIGHFQST